ncbi:MAG TPA: NAD-dependent epimerase/dehydratase family protein [Planctomycetota bacterium]|nr:NAD-dependent epimerase/dehydratase family protein [Planctomycetota bacterium]
MKILLTGATGFLGRRVARLLAARGAALRCLVRPGSDRAALAGLDFEAAEGDLTDHASLERAVDGCPAVVHLAAETGPAPQKRLREVNVEGSRALARAAAKAKAERFVYASVLGRPRPWAAIGRSKLAGELAVREVLPAMVFRCAPAFGPGDALACPLLAGLRRGWFVSTFTGQGTWKTQPVWADDLAECLAAAAAGGRAEPGVRELAGPEVITVIDFWDELARALGVARVRVHVPETVLRLGGFALARALGRRDCLRLAEFFIAQTTAENNYAPVLLGRPLTTVAEGVARMLGQTGGK